MKTISLKPPFAARGGYSYACSLNADSEISGDSPEAPKASLAYLLEDGRLLGPAHALHYMIGAAGAGRYSHWGNNLFFSASDNSNPNDNGRTYELCCPASHEVQYQKRLMVESAGSDDSLCYDVIRSALNTNGSAMAMFLAGYRAFHHVLTLHQIEIRGKTVLEVGAGPNPGSALGFLLDGAKKVYVNDIGFIRPVFSLKYAELISFLSQIASHGRSVKLCEVVERVNSGDGSSRIREALYEALPFTPAESIGLPDACADLVVSMSALEHVKDPRGVLANTLRLLKPGGMCIHSIDLKDHANPLDPLGFLKVSNEEYAARATENRWRASDFLNEFKFAGYDLLTVRMRDDVTPVAEDGNMDMMAAFMAEEPLGNYQHTDFGSVIPWVTEETRSGFIPEYRQKTLEDLSVTGLIVAARKSMRGAEQLRPDSL